MPSPLQRFATAAASNAEVFEAVFEIDRLLRAGASGAPGRDAGGAVTALAQRAAAHIAEPGEAPGPLADWLAAHSARVIEELHAMKRRIRQRLIVLAVAEAGAVLIGVVVGRVIWGTPMAGIGTAVVLALVVAAALFKPLLKPL